MGSTRAQVAEKARVALNMCAIPANHALLPHWKLFVPLCEGIRAIAEDDRNIPVQLSRLEQLLPELKADIDMANMNETVAFNLVTAMVEFFKFELRRDLPESATESRAEMDRVLAQLDEKQQEVTRLEKELECFHKCKEALTTIWATHAPADEEAKRKGAVVLAKPAHRMTLRRGRSANPREKPTVMTRIISSSDEVQPPKPPTISSVMAPDPLLPPLPPRSTRGTSVLTLESIIGDKYTEKEKADMKEQQEKEQQRQKRREARRRRYEEEKAARSEVEKATKRRKKDDDSEEDDTSGPLVCPFEECEKQFKDLRTLNDHTMGEHYWQGMLQVACTECDARFDTSRLYDAHLSECFLGKRTVTAKLWEHQETTIEEREDRLELEKRLLTCPIEGCHHVATSKARAIFKHLVKEHGGDNGCTYHCDACGKKRKSISSMLLHHYWQCREGNIDWLMLDTSYCRASTAEQRTLLAVKEEEVEEVELEEEEQQQQQEDAVNEELLARIFENYRNLTGMN